MDEKSNEIALSANRVLYDSEMARNYNRYSPHIIHASLTALYGKLAFDVYNYAVKYSNNIRVLDLGAGQGFACLPFLRLGAKVTAIDSSNTQLDVLRYMCRDFRHNLELRCEDVTKTLKMKECSFDVVLASSFLHHIPDYLGMIKDSIPLLTAHGQFFFFEDPLRNDAIGVFAKLFSDVSYFSWRIFERDLWGGIKRRIRRSKGIYLSDSVQDNAEYHVTRNGVDQDAILALFDQAGFESEILRYFSTQNRLFQPIGEAMGIKNAFSIIARKRSNGQ